MDRSKEEYKVPTTFEERLNVLTPLIEFTLLKRLGEIKEDISPDESPDRFLCRISAELVADLLPPWFIKRWKTSSEEVKQLIKEEKKGVPELISKGQIAFVMPYLDDAYIRNLLPKKEFLSHIHKSKEERIKEIESEPPHFAIIEILADMVIEMGFASGMIEKEIPEEDIKWICSAALEEIEEIYHGSIKLIGAPGSKKAEKYSDLKEKYKRKALKYFDENYNKFGFIKRKFLENEDLFEFSERQEKRDFRIRLLGEVINDWSGVKYPAKKLLKIISTYKP